MTTSSDALDGHRAAADAFVERAIAARRAVAVAQAEEVAVLADAAAWALQVTAQIPRATSRDSELAIRDLSAQIGTAIRLSDRAVQSQMGSAGLLVDAFPATFQAWRKGRIDRLHVIAIVDAGAGIADPDARGWFERAALERALVLTAAQLRPVVRVLAEHAHPESLDDRHARARARRRVTISDLGDGLSRIIADVPSVLAHGIHDRLTQMAHTFRIEAQRAADGADDVAAADTDAGTDGDGRVGDAVDGDPASSHGEDGPRDDTEPKPGNAPDPAPSNGDEPGFVTSSRRDDDAAADPRTMDELRADIFTDLLLAGGPAGHGDGDGLSAITAHVQISLPVLTIVGESREPAVLAGSGPIPMSVAKELAGTACGWDRVMTHPTTGALLAVDRYRAPESLHRFLRVRDEHCRFPGCRMPVWRCDKDHTIDAAHGGPTCADNLENLCRRHHILKHHSAWTVVQLGHGRLKWTSPTGRTYTDTPTPMVRFIPSGDPPPF